MGTFSEWKREPAEEYQHDLLLDKNNGKLLGSVQVSEAKSLHDVDPGCEISQQIRYHQEDQPLDEPNLDIPETLKKAQVTEKTNVRKGMIRGEMNGLKKPAVLRTTEDTEGPSNVWCALKKNRVTMEKEELREKNKFDVMENVKPEPLDFDFGGISGSPNERIHLEASNPLKPLKGVGAVEDVKSEAPDSDSGVNHGISERCSKRPRVEVSNTPKMPKSSSVVKKKINRSSRRLLKKQKIKINRPNKSTRLLPEKRTEMKKAKVEAADTVSDRSNVLSSKQKGFMVQQSAQHRHKRKAFYIDETYEAFLDVAVMSFDQMRYAPRNGSSNIYEEEMQSSSDSEKTLFDNRRRDICHPSYVKTKAAANRTLSKGVNGVMKKKMSCPKNYEEIYSDSDLNVQDCYQTDRYHAPFVKTKTHTEDVADLRAQTSSLGRKKKKNTKEALSTVYADLEDIRNESYEVFLSLIEVDGKNIVFTLSNGAQNIYEELEATSDTETNAMHRDPLENFLTKMDTDNGHSIRSHNQFREGLMKDLRRPYTIAEHSKLLDDAYRTGPSDHETDLLNLMESCQTPIEYGKTYLELYKDLGEKMNAADGNKPRILNLLRGLFYWSKNMSQEGSFIPWKDKRCLKVLPLPE